MARKTFGPRSLKSPVKKSKWTILKHPLFVAAAAAVFTIPMAVILAQVQHQRSGTEERITKLSGRPHEFSITIDGQTVSGKSRSPFEKAAGYHARVEVCQRSGIEDIMHIVSCYLTVRPYDNVTISSSENSTAAIYDDGREATICCLYTEDISGAPIYRIKLPPGDVNRRTYARGSEFHVKLNIIDADPHHELDAVSFSLGEGLPAVLFPVRDRTSEKVLTKEFINSHWDNPEVRDLTHGLMKMKADLEADRENNRGLTFGP